MTDNRSVDAERTTSVGRVRGLTAVLLTAVTVGCGVSDEERVRRQLDEITQTVGIDAGETQMIRQARATRLAMYLAPDVDFDVGAPLIPVQGRDRVSQMALEVRAPSSGASVAFDDVRVTIDPGTRQALATFTARISDGESVGGDLRDSRTLNVVFAEIGGEWLVQQVRFVRYP